MKKKQNSAIIILFFLKIAFLKALPYKYRLNLLWNFFFWKIAKLKRSDSWLFSKWLLVTSFLLHGEDIQNVFGYGIALVDYLILSIVILYLTLFFKRFYNLSLSPPMIQIVQYYDLFAFHIVLDISINQETAKTLVSFCSQRMFHVKYKPLLLKEKDLFLLKCCRYLIVVKTSYLLSLFHFLKFMRSDFWLLTSWGFFTVFMLNCWSVYNRFGYDLFTVHYIFFSLTMLFGVYVYKQFCQKKKESFFFFLQLVLVWLLVLKRFDTTIELIWLWDHNIPTVLEFTEMYRFVTYDFKWFFYTNNRITKECLNYSNDWYTYCELAFNDVYSW